MQRSAFDGARRRRIYLFRHGDVSYVNDKGERVADPKVVPLTDWGRDQARQTGELLAEIPFDKAVSSTLPRTIETAEHLLAGRGLDVLQHPGFVEFNADPHHRNAVTDLNEIAYAFRDALVPGGRYLGGDKFEEVNERVIEALEDVIADPDWDTLALVAHGGVNRLMLGWALGTGLNTFGAFDQNTCCFNIIDVDVDPETNEILRKFLRAANVTAYDVPKAGNHLMAMEQIAHRLRAALEREDAR